MTRDDVTRPFDHHSDEFAQDPWSVYAELRDRCPVAYSPTYGGFWTIARYEDVAAVNRDEEHFSNQLPDLLIPPNDSGGRLLPMHADPPRATEYRRLLNRFFSLAAAKALEPSIRQFTAQCIDSFIERGRCDLVLDLATPVPAITTQLLVGLPVDDWARFALPIHTYTFRRVGDPVGVEAAREVAGLRAYIGEELAARRKTPRDDLISSLAGARIDGEPLTDEEIESIVLMVIFGGVDTTTAAIGNTLLFLHRHPDDRRILVENPQLLETAVDEFLRYEPPIHGFARLVRKRCTVADQPLKPGDRVFMLWGSANRDAGAFDNPDQVELDRFPNRHLTFGVGSHRCLGANLARSEFRVVLEEVLRRIPDFRVIEEEIEAPQTIGTVYGRVRIPAVFEPGQPEATKPVGQPSVAADR
jgi:cytochrome P450